jgi:hypothetical protein
MSKSELSVAAEKAPLIAEDGGVPHVVYRSWGLDDFGLRESKREVGQELPRVLWLALEKWKEYQNDCWRWIQG